MKYIQIIRILHTNQLNLEGNSPEFICIQVSKNIVANALSRLDKVDTPNPVQNNIDSVNDHYGLEDEDISHPINYTIFI